MDGFIRCTFTEPLCARRRHVEVVSAVKKIKQAIGERMMGAGGGECGRGRSL